VAEIRDAVHPRRVVTGLDENGRSYVARDELVDEADYPFVFPGYGAGYHRVWASDRLPVPLPTDGRCPPIDSNPTPEETPQALRRADACPPPLGFRVAWAREPGSALPPGPQHWHDTTDIFFIMSGARGQILDSGEEFVLQTGDVLVQNATNHAHHMFSPEPTITGIVALGGLRVGAHPPLVSLHPVQRGPVGGHRTGETWNKRPVVSDYLQRAPRPASSLKPLPEILTSFSRVRRPRRVVVGMNSERKAYVARAEEIDEVDYESALLGEVAVSHDAYYAVWGSDRLPFLLPTDGKAPPFDSRPRPDETPEALRRAHVLPPPLGFRVGVARFAPSGQAGRLGWHDSVDVIFVMHGEIDHRLDGGEVVTLKAGDVLIQNATSHAWHNRSAGPAWLGAVSMGAIRFGTSPPVEALHRVQRGPVGGNRSGEGA
jgi:quercetin dioxygenase-like cupin family protein